MFKDLMREVRQLE